MIRIKIKKSHKSRLTKKIPIHLFIISLITAAILMNISRFKWQISKYLNLQANDEVTLTVKKFKPLAREFPPCRVIGYATDIDIQQDPTKYAKELAIIRYALAPTFVVIDSKQKILVGNFHDPDRSFKILKEQNLVLIKDFGNGVMILRRTI